MEVSSVKKVFRKFVDHSPHYHLIRFFKEAIKTTGIRHVFDASAEDMKSNPLNNCLEKGINLLEVIPNLLYTFRLSPFGIISDIVLNENGHQVVDWGKKGYIAATYDGEVHLWHPEKQVSRRVTKTNRQVKNSIKWNREGTHFAMALSDRGIAIWDFETSKITVQATCLCLVNCSITSIEWTRCNHLITGCTNGCICYWSPNLLCIKTSPFAHRGDIMSIKLSCRERGLVTTGIDRQIKSWFWPEFTPNADIEYNGPTKAVDWHPWKDSLLAVGGPVYSTIWNVYDRKLVTYREHPHPNSFVDCLSFNPVSAELLVSYYSVGDDGESSNYITVLKNLDCVVDEIKYNYGRIPYLLWDCTGTKLATASSDENLCIWDFFGTSSELESKYSRMRKKKIFTTNMMANLNQFGGTIR